MYEVFVAANGYTVLTARTDGIDILQRMVYH